MLSAPMVVVASEDFTLWLMDPAADFDSPMGVNPAGVLFDGLNVWVTNWSSETSSVITKL